MASQLQYDVVIVGASIGGCAAARLYAQRGLRVALLEKNTNPAHYKKLCTHFLQPLAMPTIQKLGLAELIETAGGRRNRLEVWTEWGWIRGGDSGEPVYGYNIRRQTLDPLLRNLATGTPGVDFFPGTSARELIRDATGRVAGVVTTGPAGRREFRVPLVVAADGRASRVAELAGTPARVHENGRFTYFTYYRGVSLSSSANSHYWHLDPNLAYAFENDDDTTLLGIFLPRRRLAEFRTDPLGRFRRFWDQVPDAPRIGGREPICELRGITQIDNHWRPASAPGLAFIGDAAMVLDPIWGTGCSFALASADWLVEHTAPALGTGRGTLRAIDRGLKRYRKLHRARTRWHYAHIASFSTARPANAFERLVFSAATRESRVADCVLRYVGRTAGPLSLASPPNLCRAVAANLKHLLTGRKDRAIHPSAPVGLVRACHAPNSPLPSARHCPALERVS